MRLLCLLCLLVALSGIASGQANLSKLLEEGIKRGLTTLAPVSASEQKEVLTATASLLQKHVKFRPDGTAATTYHSTSTWQIEWRKLVVRGILKQAVSDADRLNGVTRRYHASLGFEASRYWKPGATNWTAWQTSGFPYFPSGIIVEERNGTITARGNAELPKFLPGPGPSIMDQQPPGNGTGLPPGMSRIK